MRPQILFTVFASFLVLSFQGCSSKAKATAPEPVKDTVVLSAADEALYQTVFAPPTAAELSAVKAEFQASSLQGIEPQLILKGMLDSSVTGTRSVWIVSHLSDGHRQYGAVVFPTGTHDSLPVLLMAHPGDNGVSLATDVGAILRMAPELEQRFAIVIPSFRSEVLKYKDSTWTSEGDPSPWDRDVLDGLRLVSAVESLFVASASDTTLPRIASGSVRAMGFSRGGGVALLSALRDPRIRRVVDYFGPTDFYGDYVKALFRKMLAGQAVSLPGVDYLDTAVVKRLQAGTIPLDSARRALLVRSPARFADLLPPVMLHHGELDSTVLISQSEDLWAALQAQNPTAYAASFFYRYPLGGHDPFTMLSNTPKTVAFLLDSLVAPTLARRLAQQSAPVLAPWKWELTDFQ